MLLCSVSTKYVMSAFLRKTVERFFEIVRYMNVADMEQSVHRLLTKTPAIIIRH